MDTVWVPLLLSLKVAGWATAINLVLGVAVGFFLARVSFFGRDFLDTVLRTTHAEDLHAEIYS